jgi:hypothetical protein
MLDYTALYAASERGPAKPTTDEEERTINAHARRVRDKLLGVGPSGTVPRQYAGAIVLGRMMATWAECDWVGRHDHRTWRGWDEMREPVSGEIAVAK